MLKTVTVDGKEYLSSTALAERFSYTTDYLGKLAREGKITATKMGRQWFIDEDSLKKFVAVVQEEKAKRSEWLRNERKREQVVVSSQLKTVLRADRPTVALTLESPVISLLQAVAVTVCGGLVGLLGYLAQQHQVSVPVLAQTGQSLIAEVTVEPARTVFERQPDQLASVNFSAVWDWLFGTTKRYVVEDSGAPVNYAPVKPLETELTDSRQAIVLLDGKTSSTTAQQIHQSFSDEIEVTFDAPNTGVIQPVFTEKTDESYRFVLLPVAKTTIE